jgi:hypothetical protein
VCVFVIRFKTLLVDVRVSMGLAVMAVLVLVLDVLMIMQDMSVRMRHIAMSVLMSVLRSHVDTPSLAVSFRRDPPSTCELNGPLDNINTTPEKNVVQVRLDTSLNALNLHLAKQCRCLLLLSVKSYNSDKSSVMASDAHADTASTLPLAPQRKPDDLT